MTSLKTLRRAVIAASALSLALVALLLTVQSSGDGKALYAKTFDTHWERMNKDYPYFELYGVDWKAERAAHRPRALAAENGTEFAWELARMISILPDPHVGFIPSMDTIKGRWSMPEVRTRMIGRRPYVEAWPEDAAPVAPPAFAADPRAYPEIVGVQGMAPLGVAEILAAGPLGTTFEIRLRWPDGTETDHELRRPDTPNLPPPNTHYGDRWLVTGRVGSIGYLRVKTFDPKRGTLEPDGKMTTMLRAALRQLSDTDGLVIDLQGNGGGLVGASDPFLGNLLEHRLSYRWGNSGGQERVIRPTKPRYRGKVVVIVDERSGSGGEWAARILRDAGRATVVGGPTVGAEAAVLTSEGPDGSVVTFSGWPMVEPGITPFQATGIQLDHAFPLTIEEARVHGMDEALSRVRRARFAKALETLGAPASDIDRLVALADAADRPTKEVATRTR